MDSTREIERVWQVPYGRILRDLVPAQMPTAGVITELVVE